ncbi:SNARE-like domain protein [Leptospira inadai serovar Lyme str. 10]|uniref:SNARE-like domain protein n=2 Tax=Leptospira inadai serovar Lyme TaxID=293084 RepID=V6HF89_9LEPT|nr:DedA family protein [Leptospira inadai]EQA38228.1 SNARE-like domain protein [Leptospira inadai serovar Lyme str. 10]PNV74041.1 DedA family protein [Leptospira inadai serovar Lyme]
METIKFILDFFLHLEHHLDMLIQFYGIWVYLILFLIVFCETGLVVTPFLPGDSLLFAVGAFASRGSLDLITVILLLIIAAILGDTVNYTIGNLAGEKILAREKIPFLNKKHLEKAHRFYEVYGGKTIIIARFIPIVRTFAPFVAGIGKMTYSKFIIYNIVGGIAWILIFSIGGYLFGNLPFIQRNFKLVIIGIIIVSILPAVVEYIKERRKGRLP